MSEIDSDTYVMVFLELKLLIYINFKFLIEVSQIISVGVIWDSIL